MRGMKSVMKEPQRRLNCLPEGHWENSDAYADSLLAFISSSELFVQLCGGVHLLDFLTKEPCLYTTLLPEEWRAWFALHHISDILDLFMRENENTLAEFSHQGAGKEGDHARWRGQRAPPIGLVQYILDIRKHALDRKAKECNGTEDRSSSDLKLQRQVIVGMKSKKIHEVQKFARYIDDLSVHVEQSTPYDVSHIIDFGSGQNYLGRALASPPFRKTVVALESKQLNIDGAKTMDVFAGLAEKEKIMRNKKLYRSGFSGQQCAPIDSPSPNMQLSREISDECQVNEALPSNGPEGGSMLYVETVIQDGDMSEIIKRIPHRPGLASPQLMVVSLHSCGNLLHHGLRSLILNPAVKAVAMVGCCHNLLTERIGPSTYKLPSLRTANLRLEKSSSARDPHGFPMSEKLATYKHAKGTGICLNITARMMAVQAPYNWTPAESESFFTRHFYRALLQRIFYDRGIIQSTVEASNEVEGDDHKKPTGAGPPIIIGSLRKSCYASFILYVRGALQKLAGDAVIGPRIIALMSTLSDEDIDNYADKYADKRKELSIVWSLMAFSASVVESAIVLDRWSYLKEQPEVKECWVDCVFDYKQSPRNIVIVGIKH